MLKVAETASLENFAMPLPMGARCRSSKKDRPLSLVKPASAPRICEYFVKPTTPVVVSWAVTMKHDFDGNRFNDITIAHFLELERKPEKGIENRVVSTTNMDSHGDVLQSLHRWP